MSFDKSNIDCKIVDATDGTKSLDELLVLSVADPDALIISRSGVIKSGKIISTPSKKWVWEENATDYTDFVNNVAVGDTLQLNPSVIVPVIRKEISHEESGVVWIYIITPEGQRKLKFFSSNQLWEYVLTEDIIYMQSGGVASPTTWNWEGYDNTIDYSDLIANSKVGDAIYYNDDGVYKYGIIINKYAFGTKSIYITTTYDRGFQVLLFSPSNGKYVSRSTYNINDYATKSGLSEISTKLDDKANKDGNYPLMSVGFANELIGDGGAVNQEFSFRPTAGEDRNVLNNSSARIESINGNSIVSNNEIINGNYGAIKTVGFNAFNGTYAKVCGGCPYYLGGNYTSLGFATEEGGTTEAITLPTSTESVGTTPSDRLYTPTQNGYLYAEGENININLSWDEYSHLNGTYKPYKFFIRDLSWIINYFPDGMRSAGSVRDEIRFNSTTQKWEAVQKVGVVDLGSLPWNIHNFGDETNQKYAFRGGNISGGISPVTWTKANLLMPKYTLVQGGNVHNVNYSYGAEYVNANLPCYLKIRDDSYTDAATFKAAMSGVMLNYELAVPIVTEIVEDINLDYDVSDYGTEELIVEEGKQSAPLNVDVVYQPNALATIKQVPDILKNIKNIHNDYAQKDGSYPNLSVGKADALNTPSGSILHSQFVRLGAVWNDSTKFWELNGLTDLTTSQMEKIWDAHITMGYCQTDARTNFPNNFWRTGGYNNQVLIPSKGLFASSYMEVFIGPAYFANLQTTFSNCEKLQRVDNLTMSYANGQSVANAFSGCTSLTELYMSNICRDIDLSYCPLTIDSIVYMITRSRTANNSVITLRSDIYQQAIADVRVQEALATYTNITLAEAE